MCGDFNQVMHQDEKWGGRPINPTRANSFSTYMHNCRLLDLGFKGSKFTWSNHRKSNGLLLEWLDRGLANHQWSSLYPHAHILHLPWTFSDHNPLHLQLDKNSPKSSPKLFKLETFWTSHLEFRSIVSNCYKEDNLICSNNSFAKEISEWSKSTIDKFRRNKSIIQAPCGVFTIPLISPPTTSLLIWKKSLDKNMIIFYAL